ncbi:MAG: hypothetical protein C4342_07965 [Armatimonadota bacterium]
MAKEKPIEAVRIEKERSQFRQLIAKNPNHFGNLEAGAKALKWSPNTKYEQLTCLGYNPDLDQLEAVIGGIVVTDIDASSGLTLPSATFENGFAPDSLGRPCPFAARVVVTGPNYPGMYYRVQVRRQNPLTLAWESWANVTTTLNLVSPTLVPFSNAEVADGFFLYAADIDNRLAWWDTAGDELWELRLQRATAPNDAFVMDEETHRVQLDNTWPEAHINIDSGGNCKDFTEGVTLTGHFVARDKYLGSYSLGALPFAAPAGQLVPSSGTTQTAVSPGDPWSLNTTGMQPCGYVMVVNVWDRAIVNSASVGHQSSQAVGFCLRK